MKTLTEEQIGNDSDYYDWQCAQKNNWVKAMRDRTAKKSLAMAKDPLIAASQKAYRKSNTAQLDKLLAERSRWSRKVTIATNKLAAVDEKIRDLAIRNTLLLDGVKEDAK